MKKVTAQVWMTIIVIIMAFFTVMTFLSFNFGTSSRYNSILSAIETDYDLSGGTAYTLTVADDNLNVISDDNIKEIINTLKYRMDALGYDSYALKALKVNDDYAIRIEARGDKNNYGQEDTSTLSSDISVVAAYGDLVFYGGTESSPSGEDKIILDGMKVIKNARYTGTSTSGDTTYYQVAITFTNKAYKELMQLLTDNDTYYVSIKLGDTELLSGSSALSSSYFDGKTLSISTSSEASARQAALQIKSGGLEYKFDVSDGESVSAPLGENAILFSRLAVAIVMLASVVYLAVRYKGYGVIAALSEIAFMLLYLIMLLAIPGIKVSIGGVIGMIVATVLTVDGIVVTAKRIKEEADSGKMIKPAIKTGFRRAFKPVINSAVVSLIVALLAFALGGGVVKCFGITLAIGSVLSGLTTLLINRFFTSAVLALMGYKYYFLGIDSEEEGNEEEYDSKYEAKEEF